MPWFMIAFAFAGTQVERQVTTSFGDKATSVSICEGNLCQHTYTTIGAFPAGRIFADLDSQKSWLLDEKRKIYAPISHLPGLDRIFGMELTFLGDTGVFRKEANSGKAKLQGEQTSTWVATDDTHRLEVWVDPDQVRSADDYARRFVFRVNDPGSKEAKHQLAQIRTLPGFPIRVKSAYVDAMVTSMKTLPKQDLKIPANYTLTTIDDVLGIPISAGLSEPADEPPTPDVAHPDLAKAQQRWQTEITALAPDMKRTWTKMMTEDSATRFATSWFAVGCGSKGCQTWDLEGKKQKKLKLPCAPDYILAGHRDSFAALCSDEWTQVTLGDRISRDTYPERKGEAFTDSYGQVLYLVEREDQMWVIGNDYESLLEGADIDVMPLGAYNFHGYSQTGTKTVWLSNGTTFEPESEGTWQPVGDVLVFTHNLGGLSVFDGVDFTFAKTVPTAFDGSGTFLTALQTRDRMLWVFDKAVVVVDKDLVPIEAFTKPASSTIIADPNGYSVYAVDWDGTWSKMALKEYYPEE